MNINPEHLPIVLQALNVGFLQTLKLFLVTLIGSIPLGLIIAFGSMSRFKPLKYFVDLVVWVIRGTPLMIQILIIFYFPGLVLGNPIWGGVNPVVLQPQQSLSFLITPVTSRLSTAAAFRAFPRASTRPALYSA